MNKIGVIHGRFQPFHKDHLKYVLAGFEKVDFLYIGLTNPDPSHTIEDYTDLRRSQMSANPCTYYERLLMVRNSLFDKGIDIKKFCIVPFPINLNSIWKFYLPQDAIYFLTIYDDWGEKKLQMFTEYGLETHILWRKSIEEKGFTGSEIRKSISLDKPWKHFVPNATYEIIKTFKIDERIRELYLKYKNISPKDF